MIYNYFSGKKIKFLFLASFIFLFFSVSSVRADTVGEKRTFFVDPNFDADKRSQITAVLIKVTPLAYFYVDEKWWNFTNQDKVYQAVSELGEEFQDKIHPILTSAFGPEWNPGIDKDPHIFIVIHPMKKAGGGYFNSGDEYPKVQNPRSNEHEMIYLNSERITSHLAKSFLSHEFVHLITFNQKENAYNVSEETWLNEARAEYAPTLVGYDDDYKGSNLEKRANFFSEDPSDSLLDWDNKEKDYGAVNLFIHYLAGQYGDKILIDSLHSPKTGVESINDALAKNGYKETFSQIFVDWTIASIINDCNYGRRYCYLNKNLRNFYVFPQINLLPISGKSTLTFTDVTEGWAGNWYKIIGGRGDIKLSFMGSPDGKFNVPYIIKKKNGGYFVNFLELDKNQKGEIEIKNFGSEDSALIIIPSAEASLKPDSRYFSFSWEASIKKSGEEEGLIARLMAKIEELKKEIALVQEKIRAILDERNKVNCEEIKNNLYYGLRNDQEVRCLQKFLREQGQEIYPEGLVTGNFLQLTRLAVVRFQEKFAKEILEPLGLKAGTGYVGPATRKKINEILSGGGKDRDFLF